MRSEDLAVNTEARDEAIEDRRALRIEIFFVRVFLQIPIAATGFDSRQVSTTVTVLRLRPMSTARANGDSETATKNGNGLMVLWLTRWLVRLLEAGG